MYSLLVFTLLQVVLCYGTQQHNYYCSLENPQVFIHYYSTLTAIDVSQERKEYYSNSCAESETDLSNCCSCFDNAFICSSFADAVSELQTQNPKSIFIGLVNNETRIDEIVVFDFDANVAVASVGEKGDHGIYCATEKPCGLVFRGLNHVYIGGIAVNGCGRRAQRQERFTGAVQLENCLSVVLEDVSFLQSIGSAIVYNNTNTDSNNLKQRHSNMTVLNCTFSNNSLSDGTQYGGGIVIFTSDTYLSLVVAISDSQFYNNRATYGGSIALIANGVARSVIVLQVTNTVFTDNMAMKDGGVYYQVGPASLVFTDSTFCSNSALHFGGVANILEQSIVLGNSGLIFHDFNNCKFTDNSAFSYPILYFSLPALVDNERLEMNSVTINENRLTPEIYDTDNCMVYLTNVNVYVSNGTDFMNNQGSVVCLDNAYLHLEGNVTFHQNFGYRGGAINMKGDSLLYLYDDASVLFSENNAVYGGAIYKGSTGRNTETQDSACIFDFQEAGNDYNVTFANNLARLSGLMIYIVGSGSADNCILENQNVVFSPSSDLNIETSAIKFSFHEPVETDINGTYTVTVSLGIYLFFNLNITSQTVFNSSALFYITLLENGQEYFGSNERLKLNGPAVLSLSPGETLTNLYFTGLKINDKNDNQNFSLAFHLAEDYTISEVIKLNLIPCKLGFEYNDVEKRCVCVKSSHLLCNERQNLSCIERGFWYGDEGVVIPCSSGFCKSSSDNCTSCELEGGGHEYCRLQDTEEEECMGDRTGLGCVYCRNQSSYTYGAQRCIDDKHCDRRKDIPVIVICSILFLAMILVIIYCLLKLDNQTDFGYLYGIIYYYSVIGFIIPVSLVDNRVSIADVLIQSFVSMSPLFLGKFDLCFGGRSRILLTALNYAFPITISLLCGVFILLARTFPRYIKFKDNFGVRATCVIILLSFTAILDTSFHIINPVEYTRSDGQTQVHVSLDPELQYLDKDRPDYIVLWLVGMLFIIVFILPFTFFMLFSPLLMRYCNMIKIKPFLDQFHGCYKDKYRWMAGFYFLSRLIYFAIIIDPNTTVISSYPYIRNTSVAILVIHCLLQPYKSKLLNISDAIILGDIASLSLIHNISDLSFFGLSMEKIRDPLRVVVTYILLYIPATCVIVLIIIYSIKKRSNLIYATLVVRLKLQHYFHLFVNKISRQSDHYALEESDSDDNLQLDFAFGGGTTITHRESILAYLGESDRISETRKTPRISEKRKTPISVPPKPSRITPSKPNFSELVGSGVMSPGDRQGSFLVEYVNYKQESSEERMSEMDDFTY